MNVSIIITESQKRMILSESLSDDFEKNMKKNSNLVEKIVSEAKEQIGVNLEFLLSWGATIGGFVGPITDFIQGRFPDLSDIELSLLITGIITTYYVDNKQIVKKVYNKIVEEGLGDVMEKILKKSDELKSTFISFIKSLGITLHKLTNILSYSFIIPLLPKIYEIASQGSMSDGDISEIVKRLAGFGIVTISGIVLRELVFRLLKRFSKSKD